jgi:phosphatidylglycerol:prolipoprotein diacylglycerol transferase
MTEGLIHDFNGAIGTVFGFSVYWYGAAYSVGFLGVFGWFAFRRRRLGWPIGHALDIGILVAIGVLVGGRLFDILFYELGYYTEHPWQALNWWRGGLASHGVLLGGFLCIVIFSRLHGQPLLKVTDELAVPAAFLLAVGRLGNFVEGGVIGTVTTMPWGVQYLDVEGARHPVALYESAKNLLLVPILAMVLQRAPAGRGIATALFVLFYAGLRFVVDLLRDYESRFLGLDTGQYFNLAMAVLGVVLLVWALRRPAVSDGGPVDTKTSAGSPVGIIRPLLFAFLCLYPLGIPTSWTQINIEQKRQNHQSGRRDSLRPGYAHEQQAKAEAPGRVDVFHPSHPTVEVGAEIGVSLPVLLLRSEAYAIPEDGLQPVKFGPRHIYMVVDDDAGDALPTAPAHDSGLAAVDGEAFLGADRGCQIQESAPARREFAVARKGQIVAITAVACA